MKKTTVGVALSLILVGPNLSHAKPTIKADVNIPARHRPLKPAASFQFCFEVPHGRCFNTTATGRLRQVGGKSESQAIVTASKIQGLENEIAAFMKSTFSAAPRKARACQQTLVYRSFDIETLQIKLEAARCLEFLNKTDTENLSKLVAKLSLATKPSK